MINPFKYYTTKKSYRRLVEVTNRMGVDSSKINKIAILLYSEKEIQQITEDIEDKFGISKSNITPLIFKKKIKEEEKSPVYFTDKDFDKKGTIISETLASFIAKDFDLLINYSKKSNIYLNLITLFSKAKFKVGYAKIDDRLYNLMVKSPGFDIKVFHQEICKYLSILNKL